MKALYLLSAFIVSMMVSTEAGAKPAHSRPMQPAQAQNEMRPTTEELNSHSLAQAMQANTPPAVPLPLKTTQFIIAEGTGIDTPPIAVTPALPEHFYHYQNTKQ